MSEEAKKTAPAQEAEQPETAPEEKAQQAAPEQEPAAEAADPKDDKKKDGGWFNKKARELEAVKAKLDAAEANAAQAKDQLLRMAAECFATSQLVDGVLYEVLKVSEIRQKSY